MNKPQILLMGAYPDWDLVDLEAHYHVHKIFEAEDRDMFLAKYASHIRAVATRAELGASAALMRRLPNLELVSCYGVGTDAIDLAHARANRIRVTNTPDVLTEDVADIALGLLLATARLMVTADAFVRSGQWGKLVMPLATRVAGKRLGIVGMGRIGQAIARRASAFGCEIRYVSRNPQSQVSYNYEPDLIALADWCEFLIVIVPGGETTRDIIDADVLKALGPDGILVNVSRGSTVDEEALLKALEDQTIKAAGLDVFLNEPTINPRFLELDNVVLQPHHGSGTIETRKAMGKLVRDNLSAHFSGKPLLTPVA